MNVSMGERKSFLNHSSIVQQKQKHISKLQQTSESYDDDIGQSFVEEERKFMKIEGEREKLVCTRSNIARYFIFMEGAILLTKL